MRSDARWLALCLVLATSLAAASCASPARVSYIPEGRSYRAADLVTALEDADPGRTSRIAAGEIGEARQQALADLRSKGEEASLLANTLTSEFPTDVAAVPFRVERGTYEGKPAWIVFEAWAEPGESPTHRRLWVFAIDDLSVLAAQSLR